MKIGTAKKIGSETEVRASAAQLRAWSQRPGASWPCSTLARTGKGVFARFDIRGDLVDTNAREDVDGTEFSAWASDVLCETFGSEHPAIR